MELLEFEPGLLYLLSSPSVPSASSRSQQQETETTATASPLRMSYIHVEKEFPYQHFYLDFGPLQLAHVFAFARRLEAVGNNADADNQCDSDEPPQPQRVCVATSMAPQHRANAVCLLGCWAILFHKWTAERAFAPFRHLRLPSFHDASPHHDTFGLRVLDVLRGLERAVQRGLFSAHDFDAQAFLNDMDPETTDLSWITPRIAAFAGPQSQPDWCGRTQRPHDYVSYFRSRGVTLVVRLNSLTYDPEIFTREGIEVVDLYFPDGTCPSEAIVLQFLMLCRQTLKAPHAKIAVHCRAGLGRTGTLLACHLMASHGFSAEEAIGWLRICRPGSVIGSQQHFLQRLAPRFATFAATDKDPALAKTPEDRSETVEEKQNCNPPPRTTKGIATRSKPSVSLLPGGTMSRPQQKPVLPPKIPGRRVLSTASQGDLLLLRKHEQLPFGPSLWHLPSTST